MKITDLIIDPKSLGSKLWLVDVLPAYEYMENNQQSRKWTLVINHPLEVGLDHAAIAEILQKFIPTYYCMADEISATGTYHTHVFLYSVSPIRFSTLKNRFAIDHIEKSYGSAKENREYIRKEGKWAETEKAETCVAGTFEEWGELPAENEEKTPQMFRLVQISVRACPRRKS